MLTILHLSDFHFSKSRSRDQKIVVDALSKDLKKFCIGHRKPDLIIFTGDLVNAAGVDNYFESFDLFIDKISSATGCAEERIFIAPGNHDASQQVVKKYCEQYEKWRNKINDMNYVNNLYESSSEFESITGDKFKNFYEFNDYVGDKVSYRNHFVSIYNIEDLDVDLFVLNTAVFSGAGYNHCGSDDRNLAVAEYAIRDALEYGKNASTTIFAFHHPISNLTETSEKHLRSMIEKNADIILFGHLHSPRPENIVSIEGSLFSNQSGAIFAGRDSYVGYALICVEPEKAYFETILRTYFDDRGAFDDALDVVKEGRFYFPHEAKEFWQNIGSPFEEKNLRKCMVEICLSKLNAAMEGSADGERSIHDVFVPPPIMKVSFQKEANEEGGSTVETVVDFETIVNEDNNTVIYALSEHGKTSFLRKLEHRFLHDAIKIKNPRIPLFVDFEEIKYSLENFESVIRSRYLFYTNEFDVSALLRLGNICVLIDDVDFANDRNMSILRKFVSKYSKIRYIFAAPKDSEFALGARAVPEMPLRFEYVELSELNRRQMRQLVFNYSGKEKEDAEALLDRIQTDIAHINLPLTPANGSILLIILEEQTGFKPINRSVLIEQFVDVILRKSAVEQSRRETFDYTNKTALLAHVAKWMAENNSYNIASDELQRIIRNYLENLGFNVNASKLFDEFMNVRIFIKRADGQIVFRYRAVLEYFIALSMVQDPNFKLWVLEDERYLSFISEIQYYAGKVRYDAALVEMIESRCLTLVEQIEADIGVIDLGKITELILPAVSKDDDKATVDYLSQQLSEDPLTEEERDQVLDAEMPRDAAGRQEIFRPKINDDIQKLFLSALLYSGLVKNMELIPDTDKRRHLKNILGNWGRFLHMSLKVADVIAKHRRIRIKGVLYEVAAPHDMSEETLTRLIALNLPSAVSRVIAANLGTEKLEKQLLEPILAEADEPDPLIFDFFRASLLGDLRLNSASQGFEKAFSKMRSSRYLIQATIHKISEMRKFDRLPQAQYDRLVPNIAEAIADMKGGTHSNRQNEKRAQINTLNKKDLLLRLHKPSEKRE